MLAPGPGARVGGRRGGGEGSDGPRATGRVDTLAVAGLVVSGLSIIAAISSSRRARAGDRRGMLGVWVRRQGPDRRGSIATLLSCISRINAWLVGWRQFFGIAAASEEYVLRALDAHIRRRLRAIVLKHWRRKQTSPATHCPWRQAERVEAGLHRTEVLVGAEPPRRSTRPCP